MAIDNENNELVDQGQVEEKPAEQPGNDENAQDTGTEQQNAAEGEAEGDVAKEGEAKGLEPWVARRLGQLTAEKHTERRARETAEAEAAVLRERVAKMFKPVEGEGTQAPEKPLTTLSPAEIDAMVERQVAQRTAVKEFNNECNRVADQGQKEFGKDFDSARATLVSAYGDVIQQKPEFLQAIVAVPEGHKVFFELGKNPQEAERVLSMAPVPMAMEISRLAASLSKPTNRDVSSAPPPIRGIDGKGRKEATVEDDDLPLAEWMAIRQKDVERKEKSR